MQLSNQRLGSNALVETSASPAARTRAPTPALPIISYWIAAIQIIVSKPDGSRCPQILC